ncbi:hypothetical protein [Paraburkholderia sp. RL17-337-BIB-A]|uniref:hypothetical protein n=1 Tax=Paraburkholderia sp. RL17-337-BIB-A TaxID=3031636 RepID=UPI0038BB9CC8
MKHFREPPLHLFRDQLDLHLAFTWIRVLYRSWQTRTPYNETVYLNVLRKCGSLLLGTPGA